MERTQPHPDFSAALRRHKAYWQDRQRYLNEETDARLRKRLGKMAKIKR